MNIFCKCGSVISDKAQAEAARLDADYPRCDGCLEIWKESPAVRAKIGAKRKGMKSKITEQLLEQYASEGLSHQEAADKIGVTLDSFKNAWYDKKRPWVKQAWNRGLSNNGTATEAVGGFGDEKSTPHRSEEKPSAAPQITIGFRTNDALTQFFYLLLRDYLPAGRLQKAIEQVRAANGKTKVLSNFHLASLAEEYAGIIQKTK